MSIPDDMIVSRHQHHGKTGTDDQAEDLLPSSFDFEICSSFFDFDESVVSEGFPFFKNAIISDCDLFGRGGEFSVVCCCLPSSAEEEEASAFLDFFDFFFGGASASSTAEDFFCALRFVFDVSVSPSDFDGSTGGAAS